MNRVNILTAVSRPENLHQIHASIVTSLGSCPIDVCWIIIYAVGPHEPIIFPSSSFEIERHFFGAPNRLGILQKNYGIEQIRDGWYYCLDDDNIIHPEFFTEIARAMKDHPSARAFAFGQKRWDQWGTLLASRETMEPNKIDNAMFVARRDLIGTHRYEQAGCEDYLFYRKLFDEYPGDFVFLDQILAYYNFLRRA
jgi:hypothetical protein